MKRIVLPLLLALVAFDAYACTKVETETGESVPPQVEKPTPELPPEVDEKSPALGRNGWLEMPGAYLTGEKNMHCHTHWAQMGGRQQRNYTLLYDMNAYTSYWVAYPLCPDHMSTGRHEDWQYDPSLDEKWQTSVVAGYGADLSTPNYTRNFYARGHQLPNADRSGVPGMMAQTYYSTNMTPQIQNGFNGGIWAKLEGAVRDAVKSDTLYVVTGASFHKVGEDAPIDHITNKNDSKTLAVPNYYWKVLLKVERSADGTVTGAETVGFWVPHEDLKGHSYTEYVTSVDLIEEWTGFEFFVNLPSDLQSDVEKHDNWNNFSIF